MITILSDISSWFTTHIDGLTMGALFLVLGLGSLSVGGLTVDSLLANKWDLYREKMYGKYKRSDIISEYEEGKFLAAVGTFMIIAPIVIIILYMLITGMTLTELAHHRINELWK